MALTPVALFRVGNAQGPRMDNVRPADLQMVLRRGIDYVLAGTGGISTFDTRRRTPGPWWRIDAGFDPGQQLLVLNDRGGHWVWQPAHDMPLDSYRAALRATHVGFTRV